MPERMVSPKLSVMAAVLIAGLVFITGGAVGSPGIQTVMGDDVEIAGYSSSGPYVYLFLTGPNLPENGVALHAVSKRADQGWFTRVSVDGDGYWSYTWHTGSIGGRLDEGTYTVWVVNAPNDRSNLAYADFRTISVTLGRPYVSVDTPVQPGGMNLQSVPEGASLMVNGEYRGKTPLSISDLSAGVYTVTFSRFGFAEQTTQVRVEGGKISEVTATLRPLNGILMVNSTPPGARVLLDGTDAGLSPVVLENISAGNHSVTLEKDGYIPAAREVMIAYGMMNPVEVLLDPVPAATPRAAGSVPAMAGAIGAGLVLMAYSHRRVR